MKRILYCLVLLLISVPAYAQSTFNPASDFLINKENSPSTFRHMAPNLYPDNGNGFLIIWTDYRNGAESYYAQRFDASGTAVGKNFPVAGNTDAAFFNDGSFLVIESRIENISYFMDLSILTFIGHLYDKNNNKIKQVNLGVTQLPWCGTGYLGDWISLTRSRNDIIAYISFNGWALLQKIDSTGAIIYKNSDQSRLGSTAIAINASSNKPGTGYMVSYTNFQTDQTEAGIYASFFDFNDSLISASVPLLSLPNQNLSPHSYNSGNFRCIPIANNNYEVFYASRDSMKLYYSVLNDRGGKLGINNCISLKTGENRSSIENISISPLQDGIFYLLVTVSSYSNSSDLRYVNYFFTFDCAGNMTGSPVIDNSNQYRFGNNLFIADNSAGHGFFAAPYYENQVSLDKFTGFLLTARKKVTDVIAGSNEINSFIFNEDKNSFTVGWSNEVSFKAKKFDLTGKPLAEEFIPESNKLYYLKDGTSMALWNTYSDSTYAIGYTIRDAGKRLRKKVTLATYPFNYYLDLTGSVISDSAFAISYSPVTGSQLLLVNNMGEKLKELTVDPFRNSLAKFLGTEGNKFYTSFDNRLIIFSDKLDSLGGNNLFPYFADKYLGNGRFLVLSPNIVQQYPTRYNFLGSIISVQADTLKKSSTYAENVSEFHCGIIDKNYYLVYYIKDQNIYGQLYSNSGVMSQELFLINSVPGTEKMMVSMGINNGKAMFTWSETRIPGNGYDIYGRIFNLSEIVSVKEAEKNSLPLSFDLSQNFPNPFNPTTIIRYSLPVTSHVSLKVYDILGKVIAELINNEI
ncbi:MAG: hypothetical protein ACM3RX_07835, partial [Methanococcaceae archaeon]